MNELEERMTWTEYKTRAEGALRQMGAVLYVPNWCPDCLTYSTPFALRFAHHRRTVHASASGRSDDRG